MNIMSKHYSKDSFDRFGDDLMEELLSYLSIDQKFKYECISRQFKRLLFNKQFYLNLDDILLKLFLNNQTFDSKKFDSILQRFPNVTSITVANGVDNKDVIFDLIIKRFDYLLKISSDFDRLSENTFKDFFEKFGSNLKSIEIHSNNKRKQTVLKSCPALIALDISRCKDLAIIFTSDQIRISGLKTLRFKYGREDGKRFEELVTNNRNTLQTLEVNVRSNFLTQKQLKPLFTGLTKLSKLKRLTLNCNSFIDNTFKDFLAQMANNCPNIVSIILGVKPHTPAQMEIEDQANKFKDILNSFNYFKKLREIKLYPVLRYHQPLILDYRCEALKGCHNLKRFQFFYFFNNFNFINGLIPKLTANFFTDIDRHLPNIQSIQVTTNEITNQMLKSLSQLKDIQEINIYSLDSQDMFSEALVMKIIDNCLQINSIVLRNYKYECNLNPQQIRQIRAQGLQDIVIVYENMFEWPDY